MTIPTPVTPIDAAPGAVTDRLSGSVVPLPGGTAGSAGRRAAPRCSTDDAARAEAGRDWWPLAIGWAAEGAVPQRPGVVVRPHTTEQVSAVLGSLPSKPSSRSRRRRAEAVSAAAPSRCSAGWRSTSPSLDGLIDVDETSLTADVRAGTFGPDLEAALGRVGPGYTLGHWPQSMDLSTVGGWLACRGAGQYSTRYGKIEDMVLGLEVVLADGRIVQTEGHGPRAATGPNLTQLFVGSEGTLGVITAARLRIHPLPLRTRAAGLRLHHLCRRPRGLPQGSCAVGPPRPCSASTTRPSPSATSSRRTPTCSSCSTRPIRRSWRRRWPSWTTNALSAGAQPLDVALVERWLTHRNDVSALAPLWRAGVVVDTAEISGSWAVLPDLFDEVVRALKAIDGTLAASAHQSHAYTDGACLYFTFAGKGPEGDDAWREGYYRQAWDAVTTATMAHGAAISHHHGIGLNRSRFLPRALGSGFDVLVGLKESFDPAGILNPGKLGLPSPFGPSPWS